MIFVDTWAWLGLAYAKDPYHSAVVAQHGRFASERRTYVTTDYVFSELITILFRVVPYAKANAFVDGLLRSMGTNTRRLIYVSPTQFSAAWAMRQKYDDKPDISFVDLTSMAVMRELGITDVFTGDAHFEQVNLGFILHPQRAD